jgi:hypothetical protein
MEAGSITLGWTSSNSLCSQPVHRGDMRAQLRQCCENIGRALRVELEAMAVIPTERFNLKGSSSRRARRGHDATI